MQNSEVNQLEHQVKQKHSLSLELSLVRRHILSTTRDALMGYVKSISAPKKIGLLYLALTLESWGKGPKGLEMEICIPSMAPCIEGNLHWILSFAMTFCSLLLFSQRNQPLVNLVDNITDFVKNEKHCGSACSKKLRANEKVHWLHWIKSWACHPDLYENKA